MKPSREEILQAALNGDVALLHALAERGADFNSIEMWTLLEEVVLNLCVDEKPFRYAIVRALLELGANPNLFDEDGGSPLEIPMLRMDTEMLRILLEAGADPNKVEGFHSDELLYDWAVCDYCLQALPNPLPEEPTEDDKKDEDSWLAFFNRVAVKYNYRRPDHLFLLRQYGAKSITEMKDAAEGDDQSKHSG
jgi:hypothetical protein